MSYERLLQIAGAWAAIATAVVAVLAYGQYLLARHKKRIRLEQHLKEEKNTGGDRGQRTILHLMRVLRMTEAEIIDAAFRSKVVNCRTHVGEDGRADALLFQYGDDEPPSPRRGPC